MFSPTAMGDLPLRNRVVYPAMTRARTPGGLVNEVNVEYYKQRSEAGMIVCEPSAVSKTAIGFNDSPLLYTNEHADAWAKLTSQLHKEGCTVVAQLWHTGRMSHSSLLDGEKTVSASALPISSQRVPACGVMAADGSWAEHEVPRELSTDEVEAIVEDFGRAAQLAHLAGFDGIEIHAGSGYLIDCFLQSSSNHRTDRYGVDRFTFLEEIIARCAKAFPTSRMGVKITPNSGFNGMGSVDNDVAFRQHVRRLSDLGIAYLHVQDGIGTNKVGESWFGKVTTDGFHGLCEPLTLTQLRQLFAGGLIANGGYTLETASARIESQEADAISFGRPFLGNPDLVRKLRHATPWSQPPQKEGWFEPSSKTREDPSWAYTRLVEAAS